MVSKRNIRLPTRFDFSYHTIFNKQCDELLSAAEDGDIELDFSQVQYLDSSALGMLVLLAKKNDNSKKRHLIIRGAQGAALDILNMANMHKIYAFA